MDLGNFLPFVNKQAAIVADKFGQFWNTTET
jgi:hypothetical protein